MPLVPIRRRRRARRRATPSSQSQFIGFGLSYKQTGELELRIAQTFPGSPAADAGLDRGDSLVSVGGKAVADLIRSGDIASVFGPEQVGFTTEIAWRTLRGEERRATLVKRLVGISSARSVLIASDRSRSSRPTGTR